MLRPKPPSVSIETPVGEGAVGVSGPCNVDRVEGVRLTDLVDDDLDQRPAADLHVDALDAGERVLGAAAGRHVGRSSIAAPEYDEGYGLGGHGGIRVLPKG